MRHWRTYGLKNRTIHIDGIEHYEKTSEKLVCFEEDAETTDLFGRGLIQIVKKNKHTYIEINADAGTKIIKIGDKKLYDKIKAYKTEVRAYFLQPWRKTVVFYENLPAGDVIWMQICNDKTFLEIEGDFD